MKGKSKRALVQKKVPCNSHTIECLCCETRLETFNVFFSKLLCRPEVAFWQSKPNVWLVRVERNSETIYYERF